MTREDGALSVQRGDLVAGRYRAEEPLGPAWRAHDESDDGGGDGDGASGGDGAGGGAVVLVPCNIDSASTIDASRWRDRRGVLPVTGTATGDAGAWLVAEPTAARTLTSAVEQWGALPAEQVLLIAAAATTALSATGPRLSPTADHILLTDDGQVLLLPIETTENDDLPTLGTALHLAAEGTTPTDPPRQPTLAPLLKTLMAPNDRATTLDRTFAELSRLGAPLEAEHGADTLHEAQAASAAAAAEDEAETPADEPRETPAPDAADAEDADATHVTSTDAPTQTMSAAELLAEAAENAAADDDDADATHISVADAVPAEADAHSEPALTSADDDADGDSDTSDTSDKPTRQVPTISAADTEADTDSEPTQISATDVVPAEAEPDTDSTATKPVPILESAAPADATPGDATQELASPDAADTKALPIPAPAEPSPTKPGPLPAETNPFVAPTAAPVPPTQAADAVPIPPMAPSSAAPPTQAAAAVPPPGAQNPWLQQPQPQPQSSWQQAPQPAAGPWGPGPGQPPPPAQQAPGHQPSAPNQPAFPPNQPPPYFPQQGPPGGPTNGKGNGGKTAAIIIGAVVALAAVVSLIVVATRSNGGSSSDNLGKAANSTASTSSAASSPSSPLPTSVPSANFPSDSATSGSDGSTPTDGSGDSSTDTAGGDVTDTASPPDLTSTPFDPTSLNAFQTDKTPLELNALVPQDFTDDKGVHYTLKAGSVQPCVQTDMSANMQDILTSNSCSKEIAAAFVDDSGQYLVSVKVLPLPDEHTATVVYNDLAKQSTADFGIWCPGSGPGASACQGDYQSATIKQYREQQHRYIILSVALAVNHSQSTSIAPWLDAAAKKAVDSAGPTNWSGNQ